jgi:hypothetical protein
VDRLRLDLLYPDSDILRQAVFARLRAGWFQVENADYGGERLKEGFDAVVEFVEPAPPIPGGWQQRFLDAVYNVLWELVRVGVMRPGNASGLNFPFLSVTEYGRRIITSKSAHPHNIERYLDKLRCDQPIDATVEAYVIESLHSFRQDRLVASLISWKMSLKRETVSHTR